MQLTQHELNGQAEFLSDSSFRLKSSPFQGDIPLGLYELSRRSGKAHHYRLSHPLAECILTQAKSRELTPAEVRFDLSGHAGKISILEPFMNQAGYLTLSLFTVEAPDQAEDYLILAAVTDAGQKLKEEAVRRVFSLSAKVFQSLDSIPEPNGLAELTRQRQDEI